MPDTQRGVTRDAKFILINTKRKITNYKRQMTNKFQFSKILKTLNKPHQMEVLNLYFFW